MSSHTEEIVWTETEDGINHAGLVIRPAGRPVKPLALIWVHGFTGRFYESQSVKIGRETASHGYTFVSGNNRGHHVGTNLRKKGGDPILGGGWWERFDESPYDVAAWIDFASSLGFERVVVIGHSLGALKVPYYQALRQDPRVAGIVAASPPIRVVISHADPELLELARGMAATGRENDLLPWGRVRPSGTVSAGTYLARNNIDIDIYGLSKAEPAIARIRCPLFVFLGTDEPHIGVAEDLEMVRKHATRSSHVTTHMFEGADHSYTDHESEVGQAIAQWADRL